MSIGEPPPPKGGSIVAYDAVALGLLIIALVLGLRSLYRRFPIHLIYRSKTHLQATFDSINDPLAIIDDSYTIHRVNRAYAKLVGRPFPEILGRKCFEVLRGRKKPCIDCRVKEVLQSKTELVTENSPHPAAPRTGNVSLTFYPFVFAHHETRGVVEHIRDITTLERLKRELEHQNKVLSKTTQNLEKEQARTREELELARKIQLGIMPQKLPEIPGIRMTATYRPIEEVGGDLYDFIRFGPDKLGIFIGDASGHGLASAFIATICKMALYGYTREHLSPSELMYRLNHDLMRHIRSGHYLTGFWGILDMNDGSLWYTRAGHPGPVLIDKNQNVSLLKSIGTFVGILDNPTYEEKRVHLNSGDRLYLFTDGIYEVMSEFSAPDEGVLGYRRFQEILLECNKESHEKVVPAIQEHLAHFTYEDDYTLIVLDYLGPSERN